ncbi:MAG: hypothetical protein K2N88_00230 [Muribaculaceae bacterium]|nr:hypothetical protein [Muribaculaceae bacterium]
MKKFYLLLLMLILAAVPAMADSNKKNKSHEELRSEIIDFKIKYLSQEMALKGDQQKKFAALYRVMSNEKAEAFSNLHRMKKNLKDDSSEAEYDAFHKAQQEAHEKAREIDRRYEAEFSKILSPRQVFKMKEGEEIFRQKMHEMRGKHRSKKNK